MLRRLLLRLAASGQLKDLVTHWPAARRMAGRFVAGTELVDAVRVVERLNRRGMGATLNYLGEHTHSEREALAAVGAYTALLQAIGERSLRAYCSVKPSQVGMLLDPAFCRANVEWLLDEAARRGTFIRLDMEDSSQTERTIELFRGLWNDGRRNVGIVVQAYLYRTARDVEEMLRLGASVRLCKGAYNEPPTVAFPEKSDVDNNFVQLMRRLLESGHDAAVATHDARIIREARRFATEKAIAPERYRFEMLFGIRRDLQTRLANAGARVAVYVPYGSEWYPYLTRRLAERPANLLFFLRAALRG